MRQDSEKKLLDTVKDHPKQTADLIVDKMRGAGFEPSIFKMKG
jgi:hypothetical protein